MRPSILSRYLDPELLNAVADRQFDPEALVIGNLAGAHKSPLAGFAVEFTGHREYVAGDNPRHIDWRVYFNREKYFVKQYELETNFVCHLLLDVSASMRYGDGRHQKLLYASRLAATLGYSVVRQSDKVSLTTFDNRLRGSIAPSNTMEQILRLTRHLDEVEAVEKTNVAECLGDAVGRMGRREIVMLFSDFFCDLDQLEAVVQQMRYNRHEVVLFQILHHDELAFDFDSTTRFVGLECDDEVLASPDDLREDYLEAARAFNDRLRSVAERNRCEYVLADTGLPLGQVLVDYLDHRQRLRRR